VIVSVGAGVFAVSSLIPAVLPEGFLTVDVRSSLVRPCSSVRVPTDTAVASVIDLFTGPFSLALPLQWGIADVLAVSDGVPVYRISSLFGVRSLELSLHTDSKAILAGSHRINLRPEMDTTRCLGYVVDIYDREEQTEIESEYIGERRLGLWCLPYRLLPDRYFKSAARLQEHTIAEQERTFLR
jgi:hypothetical protein